MSDLVDYVRTSRPARVATVVFLTTLALLLAGYMFMGRGFAHVGFPPVYVGEIVLLLGIVATAIALVRLRFRVRLSPILWLLLAFMALGLARTVPYLGTYGLDALRDAVLWGYAAFAFMVYVLADDTLPARAMRLYGRVVPVFAVWLPIAFSIFVVLSADIGPDDRGSNVPLVFFKSGDMAVHVVGSIAFLVFGTVATGTVWAFLWRSVVAVPLFWTAFVAGATNRGGLVAVVAGLTATAALTRRPRNWLPVLAAPAVLALVLAGPAVVADLTRAQPTATTAMRESGSPESSGRPAPSQTVLPTPDAPVASRSLVTDPGFELGTPNSGSIAGWNLVDGSGTIVEGGAYRGEHFASLQGRADAYTGAIASATFPVATGLELSVSVRVKAVIGSPTVVTFVNWYDSGTQIESVAISTLPTEGSTSWQESRGAVTVPANATHAQIILWEASGGGAAAGIDEVIVQEGAAMPDPADAGRSLVVNPGFERGNPYTGSIAGWQLAGGSSDILEGGYAGTQSGVLVSAAGSTASVKSNMIPIEEDADLSVSMMVKAIASSPTVEIHVTWYDSSSTRISRVLLESLATGGVTSWQETAGVVRAPPNAAYAQIDLQEAAGGAALGIDEVLVAAVASRSLVTDPGFEIGTPDAGSFAGWDLVDGSGTIVEGGAYRGEHFASLQGRAEAYTGAIASATFPVATGLDLSVSVRVKAVIGSPTVVTFVNWYDSGTQIESVAISTLPTAGSTIWQESRGAVTVPANATHAQIILWEASGGGVAAGIDEVIVHEGDFVVAPGPSDGRPATFDQIVENIASIFSDVEDEGLEGTKRFRLRWWGAIFNYTVLGEFFWTGKGFGINLADADGFQANEDRSLRAPHNSHITALARMGVPGFVLWGLLQGAFGIGMLRTVLRSRRRDDTTLAAVGAWILVYWVAMMVNTSFDPYLEGPQGGIWFWSLFGLGLVVMRLSDRRHAA